MITRACLRRTRRVLEARDCQGFQRRTPYIPSSTLLKATGSQAPSRNGEAVHIKLFESKNIDASKYGSYPAHPAHRRREATRWILPGEGRGNRGQAGILLN